MTHIEVFGPHQDLVPEWTDPDTGDVSPEHWVTFMSAEALGTDGQVHLKSLTTGLDAGSYPEVMVNYGRMLRTALEAEMRKKGVWVE